MGRRATTGAFVAVTCAFVLSACGSSQEQNATELHGYFPVSVRSSFPARQRLAQRSDFVVAVTNAGRRTIPDVAVSIVNPRVGTAAQSFGYLLPQPAPGQPLIANRSRPVWIVMRNPGRCRYGCRNLGPGGAATAYSNTWALGRLTAGQTARFRWRVEAVKAGHWRVRYEVAAGLNGYAKAEVVGASGHRPASHTYNVRILAAPRIAHVKRDGQVVYSS